MGSLCPTYGIQTCHPIISSSGFLSSAWLRSLSYPKRKEKKTYSERDYAPARDHRHREAAGAPWSPSWSPSGPCQGNGPDYMETRDQRRDDILNVCHPPKPKSYAVATQKLPQGRDYPLAAYVLPYNSESQELATNGLLPSPALMRMKSRASHMLGKHPTN